MAVPVGGTVPQSWELSPGAGDSMASLQQELEWGPHLRYQMSWGRNVTRRMWGYKGDTEGESWTMGSPSQCPQDREVPLELGEVTLSTRPGMRRDPCIRKNKQLKAPLGAHPPTPALLLPFPPAPGAIFLLSSSHTGPS